MISRQASKVASLLNIHSSYSSAQETDGGTRKAVIDPLVDPNSTQKHGWLDVKPFRKNAVNSGFWKKKWFILQDSFLVWYNKRPLSHFDIHPSGCLPLADCQVFQIGVVDGGYGFEISHPGFDGASCVLKAATLFEAQDWMDAFVDCQKATFENCQYGDAMVQKLRSNENMNRDEMKVTLRKAQEEAEKAARYKEENNRLMEKQLELVDKYEGRIDKVKDRNERLTEFVKKAKKSANRKHHRIDKWVKTTKKHKDELKQAKEAVESLEAIVSQQDKDAREELEHTIRQLREVIDAVLHSESYKSI